MKQQSRARRLLGLLGAWFGIAAAGIWIMHAQQTQNPNFTGGKVTPVEEKPQGNIAHYHFDPGARTKWHIHERGQIILVEEGVARTQMKGGQVMELRAGDTTYATPGVAHWHGAAPDQGGTQFNVSRGGITWLDEVTDAEYKTPPKR
jgi:quercetin dioxygenase-like cupin family protein